MRSYDPARGPMSSGWRGRPAHGTIVRCRSTSTTRGSGAGAGAGRTSSPTRPRSSTGRRRRSAFAGSGRTRDGRSTTTSRNSSGSARSCSASPSRSPGGSSHAAAPSPADGRSGASAGGDVRRLALLGPPPHPLRELRFRGEQLVDELPRHDEELRVLRRADLVLVGRAEQERELAEVLAGAEHGQLLVAVAEDADGAGEYD